MQDPTWSPPGMRTPDLTDHRLELRRDLVSAALRTMGSIRPRREAADFVTGDPVVDALSCDAQAFGDLGDPPPILDHRHDGLIALFHDAQLH